MNQARTTSSLAIASLVSGILGWTLLPFLGALVAIITGHMARREIRAANGQLDGDGLAVAGLVLGWVALDSVDRLVAQVPHYRAQLVWMVQQGAGLLGIESEPSWQGIRDWVLGSNGKWVTMGVPSDGSYGIPEGVIYGFPVTTANGEYTLVRDLPVDDFSRAAMDKTLAELEEERGGVAHLLT